MNLQWLLRVYCPYTLCINSQQASSSNLMAVLASLSYLNALLLCLLSNYFYRKCTNYQKRFCLGSPYRVMASNKANSRLMINYCHIQTTTLAVTDSQSLFSLFLNSFSSPPSLSLSLSLLLMSFMLCYFENGGKFITKQKFHFINFLLPFVE